MKYTYTFTIIIKSQFFNNTPEKFVNFLTKTSFYRNKKLEMFPNNI